jgi:thioredoxin-related protein
MLRSIIFILILCVNYVQAQVKPVEITQLEAFQNKDERLVMVLIETGWCKYCQAMKYAILKDQRLSTVLNKNFYTVFLNAETRNDIEFAGKKFSYKATGINTGVHQLAEQLGTINGQLSFPSLCFLNKENEIVYQYSGFLDTPSLLKILNILSIDK